MITNNAFMEGVCKWDNKNIMQPYFNYKQMGANELSSNIPSSPFLHRYSATKAATCT